MRKIKCAVLFIAACMVLAGCACEHVYDDGVVTKKPTCSTVGKKHTHARSAKKLQLKQFLWWHTITKRRRLKNLHM